MRITNVIMIMRLNCLIHEKVFSFTFLIFHGSYRNVDWVAERVIIIVKVGLTIEVIIYMAVVNFVEVYRIYQPFAFSYFIPILVTKIVSRPCKKWYFIDPMNKQTANTGQTRQKSFFDSAILYLPPISFFFLTFFYLH